MTQEHPITPPPELVREWIAEIRDEGTPVRVAASDLHIATQAARWGADQQLQLDAEQINQAWQKGADQELEACCEWLIYMQNPRWAAALQEARRPKPKGQAEKALASLDGVALPEDAWQAVSAALERLRELEGNQ